MGKLRLKSAEALWGKEDGQCLHAAPALLLWWHPEPLPALGKDCVCVCVADLVNFGFRGRLNQQNRYLGFVQFS